MIAVIADDFTGAAELAGIALRYGKKLPVFLYSDEKEELLNYTQGPVPIFSGGDGGFVVCTDSRSLNIKEALEKTEKVIKKILQQHPTFIYKKTDSALRGHIIEELSIQMLLMDNEKAIFMPANPSLGRTIKNGEYFINDIKIDRTGFANDPEFPINSSFVKELLNNEVEVVKVNEALPEKGIVVGEAGKQEDYTEWTKKIDESWVLAGGGDFFTALLSKNYAAVNISEPQLQKPFIYVCGTSFKERKIAIKKLKEAKKCVCYLENENDEEVLIIAIEILKRKQQLILAFDDEIDFTSTAAELRKKMAIISRQLIENSAIKELFIEGGSTAAAILQELNIKMMEPVNELSRGVVRMKSGDLFITVKPGSYELPNEIVELFS
ncbi:MAG: four-carbon acid sugar kinase family protein [Chitinophagaceae bacterium]